MASFYSFKRGDWLSKLMTAFDVTSGHDHDGTNSKAITFGELSLADGKVLVGNASGLATAITPSGDVTITNAGVTAIGAKKVTAAQVAIADGKVFIGGATGAAAEQTLSGDVTVTNAGVTAIGAGKVTLAQMAASAKTQMQTIFVPGVSADGDYAGLPLLEVPAGMTLTLSSAKVMPYGDDAGIDDSNTSVFELTDGTNSIVSKTYNTTVTFPDFGAVESLGTLDETHKVLAAGEILKLNITNGTTAATPALAIQVVYTLADAA